MYPALAGRFLTTEPPGKFFESYKMEPANALERFIVAPVQKCCWGNTESNNNQSSFLLEFPSTSYLQIWGTDWKVRNGVYRDPVSQ